MTFESLTVAPPDWLMGDGPDADIVLSSRARLARNIEGFIYAHKADDAALDEIADDVLDASQTAGFSSDDFFSTGDLDDLKMSVLIERHLISPALADKKGRRGVIVHETECCSIMVNEEDHLRIQSLSPGFDPEKALKKAKDIERDLADTLSFSHADRFGYLTACPTNLGTGLRLSALMHLPSLVLTKEIQRVIRSAGQLGMTVRGFRGEGSDVVGNLFQISNQKSFGRSEETILESLNVAVRRLIDYERNASDMLLSTARSQILDKIWRSVGILKTARMLSSHEFVNLASAVRLGLQLKVIEKPERVVLNELLITLQPGHLQARNETILDTAERDRTRAAFVRERFVDVSL